MAVSAAGECADCIGAAAVAVFSFVSLVMSFPSISTSASLTPVRMDSRSFERG